MHDNDPLIGKMLAGFRLERVLGRGGMATVYYGWDTQLERPVAVKVINAGHQSEGTSAERFVKEARLIAAWRHPNILQIYFAGEDAGLYYYVMEYIEGSDLGSCFDDYRRQKKSMPVEEVLRIGRAVANALGYAHERGVVHRDVKPTNVLVAEDGRVVLADFGLALDVSHGSLGTVFGSPHYIAPEQARNSAKAVPQSDVYALGVILYELLSGRVPFDDPSPAALAMQHITNPPPPPRQFNPDLSLEVETVLLKALRKKPRERYQSGQALLDALETAFDLPAPTLPYLDAPPPVGPGAYDLRRMWSLWRVPERLARLPTVGAIASRAAAAWQRARLGALSPAALRERFGQPGAWLRIGCATAVLAGVLIWCGGMNRIFGQEAAGLLQALDRSNPETPATPPPDATGAPDSTSESPTAAPSAGNLFTMYYDDTGFYLLNASGHDRPVDPITLERLDGSGNPTNRWEGWRWGQYYGTHRAGYCVVIEVIDFLEHLSPQECHNRFIVIRTPNADDPAIFFTALEGSQEFRILWDGNEAGRCAIADHYCEVYLP